MPRLESEFKIIPDQIRHKFNPESELAEVLGKIKTGKGGFEHITPEFVDRKVSEVSISDSERVMSARQKTYKERRIAQPEAKVKIETDLPATVFFEGDIHLGHVASDHKKFFGHIKKILDTPNAFVVFMHNLVDNAIPSQFPDNLLETTIPPEEQFPVMRKVIKKLDREGKVLAAVSDSCHEGWSWLRAGVDASALLYDYPERKFPVLENGGLLKLTVGKILYKIGLYHKTGPFESSINPSHAVRQMQRLRLQGEADAVIGAHRHIGNVERTYEGTRKGNRKQVAYVRSGTYKGSGEINDRFLIDRYGRSGEPPGQSITFSPDKKGIDVSLDFDEGILKHENNLIMKFLEKVGLKKKIREQVIPPSGRKIDWG